MPTDLIDRLPQQWVGIVVLVLFVVYVSGQLIEKSERVAKLLPLGVWWRERNRRKSAVDPAELTRAVEAARHAWSREENAALAALESRVAVIAAISEHQAVNIKELQDSVRAFTAFSVYDARWHHRADVALADCPMCDLPEHLDYFAFERLWREDPAAAARLPV
ncbi:hypothetical protein SEA_BOOSTSEASON_33 [Mycobacterium phage BoostSeason]|uniref:Minor tail protein n=1 Tax=Mycobacterium phage Mufasa TaxID=1718600 RepID=A0A0M4R2A7_9CAUD|nr:hypothetical protein SEA_MUFASA_33 [Mycobacterium phage Mufasa]ALF00467.1 hypothetical protein SEA_MUFASA_33 [Mycobacterium phage Mufasa]AYN57206.1 hypothetical protein SEA_BOOSTSEASON_33 [Mycobacterium phage BoostSeason]